MRLYLLAICCLIVCLTGSPALAQWTTYQGDASHDGYVPISLDPSTFSVLWQRTLSTNYLNPVTAGNGEVFVSTPGYFSDGMGLQALDAVTGETKWSQYYDDVFSVNPPAYANGKVYIQTCNHADDTYLWAYDANTGNLVYRSPFLAQWESYYAPTIYDGTVYIDGGYYGGMYAFNGSNGEQNWFAELNQDDKWTPAVDAEYAYVYSEPYLKVINRTTGKVAFQIDDPLGEWNECETVSLGTHNDAIVVANSSLICFNLANKNIRWELTRSFEYHSQATVANGIVYAIDGGAVDAIDELTGNWLWSWVAPTGDDVTGTIIATDTHLLVNTTSAIYAVDLKDHTTSWSYPHGGSLALSNRALYVAGTDGTLTAIAVSPSSIYPVTPSSLSIDISNLNSVPSSSSNGMVCLYSTAGGLGSSSPVLGAQSSYVSSDALYGTADELDSSGAVIGTGHLASVTWSDNNGGSGIGYYDSTWNKPTSWSVPGLALQPGDNVITITATDLWGNTATAEATLKAPIGVSVAITDPTSETAYSTNTTPIAISGTASAEYTPGDGILQSGIANVTWSNDRGDFGTCVGTDNWTAYNLRLVEGDNKITITATDISGDTATAAIVITYTPPSPGSAWSGIAMVSVPIIPEESDPKQAVGFEGNYWFTYDMYYGYVGYGNDPSHMTWFTDPNPDTPGRGFWAYFSSPGSNTLYGQVPDQSQPKTIHLNAGWNIIGNPFIKSVPWNRYSILVTDKYGRIRPLAESKSVVRDYLWGWDSASSSYYLVYDPTIVPSSRGTMEPWLGYWIDAITDCDLTIPPP